MVSYQATPYTHFHELVDTWTKHAKAMETQVKNLAERARVIGTPLDTAETRTRLDDDERRLHDLATKTKTILKDLVDDVTKRRRELSKDDRDTIGKVQAAMTTALTNYQNVVTNVSKKRQQFPNPNNNALIDFDSNDDLTHDDIHQRLQQQEQIRVTNNILLQQNEEQFDIEGQIQQVHTDVIEINHIMRDIGAIVSEQSPIIAGIEERVSGANDNIIAANNQLDGAARHQKKYRKKLCICLIIFVIIAAVITIVLVVKLK